MKNILIISSYYLGSASANGMCAKNLAKKLYAQGNEVNILCYGESDDIDSAVYTVPFPLFNQSKSFLGKAFTILKSFITPKIDGMLVKNYTDKALKICAEKNIDTVVAMFFPFESVSVLKTIKKRFPNIKTVIYELDSVGDGVATYSKYQALADRAIKRWCDKYYSCADKIIIMQTHEEYWNSTFRKKHGDKLVLADIPVLVEHPLPETKKKEDASLSFLYGGLIQEAYRSPNYLLKFFEEYAKINKSELHFFSKGDCEEKISEAAKRVGCIFQHGYVSEAELDVAIADADILLSIGNRVSRSVPSKLITYFACGKPVVHFSSQKEDVCMQYIEKYELGLVLCEWDTVEENIRKFQDFLDKALGRSVNIEMVEKVFNKNTPSYSASLITEA
jgi:glycosyltransferase involved in cell wall biosynthesis